MVALGQSSPGAIAINAAVLLGWRCGGLAGALVGALGTAIPPLIILSIMYLIYDFVRSNVYAAALLRGMQSGIAAVIIDAVWSMAKGYFNARQVPSLVVMAGLLRTWSRKQRGLHHHRGRFDGAVASVVTKTGRRVRCDLYKFFAAISISLFHLRRG
jgi:chromate transport protein ChrA